METNRKIEQYLAGTQLLRKAVGGMSPEQLKARPVPGKWSTLEVVCHLVDFEPIYGERMKRVIATENPTLLGADPDHFAAKLAYHDRDVNEELAIMETTRSQMARIFRKLKPEDFQRVGTHNEYGPKTLDQLLTTITNHVPHHVKFIEEKRRALGLAV